MRAPATIAAILALASFAPPAAAVNKGSVFLNGVNIDGVTNQKFENVTVLIDEKGNVLIMAKGYEVQAATPTTTTRPAAPADTGPVTRRYFLVNETSVPGMAQYDIDVFVNSVWIKRVSSSDAQAVTEITRHLHKGKNTVHFTATKVLADARKSASPNHSVKIYIGEGNMGGNNVMIDNPLLEYKRDASEMQNFADEFVIEGK
jgi:hypothetical protein